MKLKQSLYLIILLLFLFSLVIEIEAAQFTIENFESLGNLAVGGYNYGPESKVELVGDRVMEGSSAAKLTYAFDPEAKDCFVELIINKQLPATFGTLSFWAYGNKSGNPLRVRLLDANGETFQYSIGNIDWEGWKLCQLNLESGFGTWGEDPTSPGYQKIDGPVLLQSILIDRPPKTTNVLYLDEITLTVPGGTIRGQVTDPFGNPVARPHIYQQDMKSMGTFGDEQGNYSLLLKPGSQTVVVEKRGYISQEYSLTIAQDQTIFQDFALSLAIDKGIYTDGLGSEDGLSIRPGGYENWNGELVEIGGRTALRLNSDNRIYFIRYDVENSYIYGGENEVYITVEYFDLGTGKIALQYDGASGTYPYAGFITCSDTRTWKTKTFHLPDARFQNSLNGADFSFNIWTKQYDRQPDAYLGKVSVIKAGRVLHLEASPRFFSPKKQEGVKLEYGLSAPADISAWVEDQRGKLVTTLAEDLKGQMLGTFTWTGYDAAEKMVPDGIYYLKIAPTGEAWGKADVIVATVTVDTQSPHQPVLIAPRAEITVNEPRVLVTVKASPGARVRYYKGDMLVAELEADVEGICTHLITDLAEGENKIKIVEVDAAGNESEPVALQVAFSSTAVIGQVTVSPGQFSPPATTLIRFFLSGEREVQVILADGQGLKLGTIEALAPRSGEVILTWDGKLGEPLEDGEYWVEVRDAEDVLLGSASVTVDTTPPEHVFLLLPAENGTVSDGKVLFSWEGSGANKYLLSLWPETNKDDLQTYEVNLPSFQVPQLLQSGNWFWQVEAFDSAGNCRSSEIGRFIVEPKLPLVLEIRNLQGRPNPFSPDGSGRYEEFQLAYSLTQPAKVSISIYNLAGKEVYRREAFPEGVGDHYFYWNGLDSKGRLVPKGVYLLFILARNDNNRGPAKASQLIHVLY